MTHRELRQISIRKATLEALCLTCLTKFGQASAQARCALLACCLHFSIISRVWSSLIRLQSNPSQLSWFHAAQILAASPAANFVASSPCFSNSSVRIYELVNNTFLNSQMPDRSSNLHNGFSHRVDVIQGDLENFKRHLCNLCG